MIMHAPKPGLSRRQFLHASLAAAVGLWLPAQQSSPPHVSERRPPPQKTAGCFSLPAEIFVATRPRTRDNPIAAENRLPGTPDWRPSRYLFDIAGYASAASVAAGETLLLYVDTEAPSYDLHIYRTGYYGGMGGRLMETISGLPGLKQPAPHFDFATGLASCGHWQPSFSLAIPETWVSGIYVAKLSRRDTGGEGYILFVVRDDSRSADLLYQQSVMTYQAYNGYGGKSLYSHISSNRCATVSQAARAVKVSFNRPYAAPLEDPSQYLRAEYPMVYWLEAQGYDVVYSTNLDTHQSGLPGARNRLLEVKAFLSVGHDEYWTQPMRDAVTQARDAGVHLGFFSANTCYWRARLEPDPWTGEPNRTLVCYKTTESGPADPSGHPTTTWRDATGVNDPENALLGVMHIGDNDYGYFPMRVEAEQARDRLYRNTGLQDMPAGTCVDIGRELFGWEWDATAENGRAPAGLTVLARTPVYGALLTDASGNPATRCIASAQAHTTRYTAPSGAQVFAAGTIQWSWGLALMEPDERLQQMTYNVLADMGVQPATPADRLVLDGEAPPSRRVSGSRPVRWPAPAIADLDIKVTDVSATIRWRTERAAHAQVWLGHSPDFVNEVQSPPLGPALQQEWTLIDLEPGSTYFMRLAVWDGDSLILTKPIPIIVKPAASAGGARRWASAALAPVVCQARPIAQPAWNRARDNRGLVTTLGVGLGALFALVGWRWRARRVQRKQTAAQSGSQSEETQL